MKSADIKKLMAVAGVSQGVIAERLRVTKNFVYQVIHGIRSTERVRQAIADAVGKSVEELWGNRSVKEARTETEPEECIIPFSEFVVFNQYPVKKEHWRTTYKHFHSKKLGYSAEPMPGKQGRDHYVRIKDKKAAEEIEDFIVWRRKVDRGISLCGETVRRIRFRIPENLEKHLGWISSPDTYDYDRFYKFIDEKLSSTKIVIDLGSVNSLVEGRIRIYGKDYAKVAKIAENNGLTVGKVIETFLKGYLSQILRINPGGSKKTDKGGSYGDTLHTN